MAVGDGCGGPLVTGPGAPVTEPGAPVTGVVAGGVKVGDGNTGAWSTKKTAEWACTCCGADDTMPPALSKNERYSE